MNVALFDYGAGNLHSLNKALEAAGADVTITSDWNEALGLDGLVLPGVGAFGHATAQRDLSSLAAEAHDNDGVLVEPWISTIRAC